jgi:hypothetical protein
MAASHAHLPMNPAEVVVSRGCRWHSLALSLLVAATVGCPSTEDGKCGGAVAGAAGSAGGAGGAGQTELRDGREMGGGGGVAPHVDAGTLAMEPIVESPPVADAGEDAGDIDSAVPTIEEPRETIDYSCEQASDCAVKDVGNCCGYFPRCVNIDSPTPRPECSDDVGGVCGWPDISHCECVENTCRSMQGDTEV